jgi:ABC-type transport system substrate-binding protein
MARHPDRAAARAACRSSYGVAASWILAAALCACGGGESPSPRTEAASAAAKETPRPGGTLRIALENPTSLDPARTDDVYEATIVNQIFSGLVQLDANLNVLPDLAQSWTISRDRLVFRFDLRQDATFHNGRPVTADDFVYSFTRLLDSKRVQFAIIQGYLFKVKGVEDFVQGRAKTISGIRALDPHTLEITLAEPYPSFLSVLTMDQAKVLPAEEVKRLGAERFGREPVGSGPFRLAEWVPGKHACLVAYPDYFGDRPFLDSLLFVHDPEGESDWRKPAFLAHDLDLLEIRDKELSDILSQGDYRVMRRPELSVEFLGFNVEHPIFRDRRVRRAVAMAIDRKALKRFSGRGFETPVGILPPGIPGFTPDSKVLPHDPEAARALLAEAGYSADNPLVMPLMTASRSRYAVARDSIVIASLAEAGIQVDLQQVTWGEFDHAISDRTAAALELTWIADLPDPDSFLYTLFVSGGASNFFNYASPSVDSLLETGCRNVDQVARLDLYREAEQAILDDAAMIPLFNVIALYVLQPCVHGVELSPFGISSIPMERIWVDREPGDLHARL